ncbi:MAG TPA: hypothetical protein PKY78_06080, partial [Candidatus Omnitrophota bacterium]|nr:hypothetical protein [Candidatus Omnitrophota bacterium]
IGVSFDSDGDRIAFVAEGGREVSNNEILCLLAQGTDKPMVINSRATLGVYDEMINSGSYAKKARSGYAFIKQMARSLGSDVAGEESGHFMFGPDFVDDGIMTAGRIFGVIARKKDLEGKNFAMSANETGYNKYVSMIDRIKVELKKQSDRNKNIPNDQWKDINQSIINKLIAAFSTPEAKKKGFWLAPEVKPDVWKDETRIEGEVDGFMVYFGKQENGLPQGWALYRPSLSQPDKVYIDFEADSAVNVALLAAELRTALSDAVASENADLGSLTDLLKTEDMDRRIDRTMTERAVRTGEVQTKKAPGTDTNTDSELKYYQKLFEDKDCCQQISYSEKAALFGSIEKVFEERETPAGLERLMKKLKSGELQVKAVDLEVARNKFPDIFIADTRFFPREDRRLMGVAACFVQHLQDVEPLVMVEGKPKQEIVSTIFIPKALVLELLKNPYLCASIFVHEYAEQYIAAEDGKTRHGYAVGVEKQVSSKVARQLGLPEFTKYYLDAAQKAKNLDYLYYLLETYSPQKDSTGAVLRYLHEKIYLTLQGMGRHKLIRYHDTPKKVWLWYRNMLEYDADPYVRKILESTKELFNEPIGEVVKELHKKLFEEEWKRLQDVFKVTEETTVSDFLNKYTQMRMKTPMEYESDPYITGMFSLTLGAKDTLLDALEALHEDRLSQTLIAFGADQSTSVEKFYYQYPITKMADISKTIDKILLPGGIDHEIVENALFRVSLQDDMASFVRGASGQNYLEGQCDYPIDYPATIWLPKAPVQIADEAYIRKEYKTAQKSKLDVMKEKMELVERIMDDFIRTLVDNKFTSTKEYSMEELDVVVKHLKLSDNLSAEEKELGYKTTEVEFIAESIRKAMNLAQKDPIKVTKKILIQKVFKELLKRRADLWIAEKLKAFVDGFLAPQIAAIRATKPNEKIVVGIVGPGGAGKSTMVKLLKTALIKRGCDTIEYSTDSNDYLHSMRDRYLQAGEPQRIPSQEQGGMYNNNLLRDHLSFMKQGKSFMTLGDPKAGTPAEEFIPRDVNIIEGVYAVHEKESRAFYDIVVALADEDKDGKADKEKFQRKMKRDVWRLNMGRAGFTLPYGFWDYAKKQFWEQTDITAVDTREVADIVWSQDTNTARIKKTSKIPVMTYEYQKCFNALKEGLSIYARNKKIDSFIAAVDDLLWHYTASDISDEVGRARRAALKDAAKLYPFFSSGLLSQIKEFLRVRDQERGTNVLGTLNGILKEIWIETQDEIKDQACVIIPAAGKGATAYPFSTLGPKGTPKYISPAVAAVKGGTLLSVAVTRSLKGRCSNEKNLFIITTKDKRDDVYDDAKRVMDGLDKGNIITEPEIAGKFVTICVSAMMLEKRYNKSLNTVVTLMTTEHDLAPNFITDMGEAVQDSQVSATLEPVFSIIGAKVVQGKAERNKGAVQSNTTQFFSGRAVYQVEDYEDVADGKKLEAYNKDGKEGRSNSGMVSFTIATLYAALAKYAPDYYDELMRLRSSIGTQDESKVQEAVYKRFRELDKKYSTAERPRVFESLLLQKISSQENKDRQAFGLTVVKGLKEWGDLGSIVDRPVDFIGSNFTKGATQNIDIDSKTKDCNVITDEACNSMVHVFGMTNAAIAYNSDMDTLVVVDRDNERRLAALVDRLYAMRSDPNLRKYVEVESQETSGTEAVEGEITIANLGYW